jgi:hypothetical protein
MREPLNDREKFLASRIDEVGRAVLDAGSTWEDGILNFSHPYDSLSDSEERFVNERLAEWKRLLSRE